MNPYAKILSLLEALPPRGAPPGLAGPSHQGW